LDKYTCDDEEKENNVSNVIITFLTDGEDNSGKNIKELPKDLQNMLKDCWKGSYQIHSVGFGKNQ
jgi:hypothetical protein